MQIKEPVYCDICGAPIEKGREHRASVEGTDLVVCSSCFAKIELRGRRMLEGQQSSLKSKSAVHQHQKVLDTRARQTAINTKTTSSASASSRSAGTQNLELVEDYAEQIRRARERLGWSQSILAGRVKVSENIIKRIEGGKLRPTVELAKKLEEVLGIKLLTPSVEEEIKRQKIQKYATLGEIVSVRVEE